MMNKEIKKYVNAYMDGEDVQYRLPRDRSRDRWYFVQGLSYFEDDTEFRIKPKAEDKWQRVIDEGYLCKFWDYDEATGFIDYLHSFKDKGFIRKDGEALWNYCEVLREKGIKQPYFQEDDVPEIDEDLIVYYADGFNLCYRSDSIDWSEVVAYIEV